MAKMLKFKKSLDPKEKFMVSCLVRGQIADELNEYLDSWGWPNKKEFTHGDPRLAKKVMEFLAEKKGEEIDLLDEDGVTPDAALEFWEQALHEILVMLGIEPDKGEDD